MENLEQFHFLRPLWLYALPAVLLAVMSFYYVKSKHSGWQAFLANHLASYLVSQSQHKIQRRYYWIGAVISILTVIALAGPSWEKLPQPVYQLHKGRVVLLDLSISMRATDISPDRLTRARFKIIDLFNSFAEGETGLVVYAGDAFTISPLTTDTNNLLSMVPSLSPEIMPVSGDEPSAGLTQASELLSNAGYQQGDIFWITDGIEAKDVLPLQKQIETMPFRVSILGVGTAKGAPITLANGELYKDSVGNIEVPRMQSRHLLSLTNKSGGNFSAITIDDSDISHLLNTFAVDTDVEDTDNVEDNQGDQWLDAGFYLLIILVPLFSLLFRKGLIFSLALLFIVQFAPSPAYAFDWKNLWQTKNQQAANAFDRGEFKAASKTFDDPRWKAIAHYKNGEYETAAELFSQFTDAEGQYNLGNAELKQGNLEQAIEAYNKTLSQQADHQDAIANKALAEELLKQQQEQNNQEQQDNKQSDDNQSEQEKSDNDQNDAQQDQQDQQQNGDSAEQSEEQQQEQSQQGEQQDQEQGDTSEDQQTADQEEQEKASNRAEEETLDAREQPMTEAEKEQQQQMQLLLNKVTDDPAYLLKKRMALEYQKRRYDTRSR